ncbi:MAG: hypothetical protein Q4C34_07400 [Bacteroidales bacterium]|nr:hypothetical protein [Bacteroidales bacterium]
MKTIAQHIDYLLICNDSVTVPGLGAVVAYGSPARYDEQGSMWFPPVRALSFDPSRKADDGMIARSIARRESLSDAEANEIVARGTSQLRQALASDGMVALGHAGTLRVDDNGNMSFTPADARWLSPATMWLPQIEMRPVATATGVAHEAERLERRVRLWPTLLRRAGSAAACVAVIFAIAWALTSNLRTAPAEQFASVGPAPDRVESLIPQPGKAEAPLILVINKHPDAVVDVESTGTAVVKDAPGYYLIVASLPDLDEARKFASMYPSMHLGILEMDGRYRVFAARADSQAHAYAAAADPAIKSVFPASWVCRR